MREVKPCKVASEFISCVVISQSRLFSCVEGAEPETGSVLGQTDLSDPLAPVPLPYSSVRASWWSNPIEPDGCWRPIGSLIENPFENRVAVDVEQQASGYKKGCCCWCRGDCVEKEEMRRRVVGDLRRRWDS
uniref:Uncharacterized protein n=1 Tax=Salix viminalis TaxID=40686 RepID=A0A6N2LUG4_SALVM